MSTVTGVVPAVYTWVDPGRLKVLTLTVVPGGATVLVKRSSVSVVPGSIERLSLLSTSSGLTVMVSGAITVWPSKLVTATMMGGTEPV
jgi:hypothetical protein